MATSQEDLLSSEDPRLAYYTTTGDGFSYLSLNGTSMQNGLVLILIISVLASLLLPYYGISRGIIEGPREGSSIYLAPCQKLH